MDVSAAFPAPDASGFILNILAVLMMYGPAYLANTGAMLFGKWIPEKLDFESVSIDGGRNWTDGYRLLGDGKTWNGLFGGAVFSGLLVMLAHWLWGARTLPDGRPFVDPTLLTGPDDWFWVGGEWGAAFAMGFVLGLACMLGDAAEVLGGDRKAVVCRELTKKFEEARRGTLSELASYYGENTAKGEIVVLIDRGHSENISESDVTTALEEALKTMSVRDASDFVAKMLGQPRRPIYQQAMKMRNDDNS